MKQNIFFVILTMTLIGGCSSLSQENPLFEGTRLIVVTSPKTTATSTPTFVWNSPEGIYYQVVGVFTNHLKIEGKKIVNTQDCIAMWTSGMSGQAGNVEYSNFKDYPALQNAAPSLVSGKTYYWAVWAYNSDMEVTHSSAEISFTVQ
ncbi:MAG: hypothetical protein HPY78_07690 [Brevinematales bacterium]|nr:hypothetical protein [Brevinematales bacterium]